MVSFVVPCYNEEGNVSLIYEEITRVFAGKDLQTEIVFVNDGSKDQTEEKLKSLYRSKKDPNLKIVCFSRNFGKEAALLSGLRHTTGDYVCFIDADLQQPPEAALEMYEALQKDPALDAVGAYQRERKESGFYKFCKKHFYRIINRLCDIHFEPATSDFRMISRRMADSILSMSEYYRFSKGLFSFVGFRSAYIPYEVRERHSGKSSWDFFSLFRYAVEGIMGYTAKPLTWPLYIGIIQIVLSLISLLVLFILKLTGTEIPGNGSVLSFMFLLFGMLFVMLGVIGLYLGKTYMQVKNRPIYIEKEVLGEEKNGKQ